MLVLKRRELRVVQLSAKVVAPATTSNVAVGLIVPTPILPPVGARPIVPAWRPDPGCKAIDPPLPGINAHLVLAALQLPPVPPVIRMVAPVPPGRKGRRSSRSGHKLKPAARACDAKNASRKTTSGSSSHLESRRRILSS